MQDIGVVKSGNRYDIYAGGRATGVNPRPGRRVAQSLSDHQVVTAVGRLIHFYQQQANKRERFWQFVDQVGSEALIRAAESDE
jgi:NAD(P)H-nitrite reductase large subunit